jgi:serine/threonine protein kinase
MYTATSLSTIIPKLPECGIELLKSMLEYNPESRVSASAALLRNYLLVNLDAYFGDDVNTE